MDDFELSADDFASIDNVVNAHISGPGAPGARRPPMTAACTAGAPPGQPAGAFRPSQPYPGYGAQSVPHHAPAHAGHGRPPPVSSTGAGPSARYPPQRPVAPAAPPWGTSQGAIRPGFENRAPNPTQAAAPRPTWQRPFPPTLATGHGASPPSLATGGGVATAPRPFAARPHAGGVARPPAPHAPPRPATGSQAGVAAHAPTTSPSRRPPAFRNPVIEELERRRREGSAVQSSANGGAGPARTATGPIQHQHGGVAAAGARPAPAAPGGRIHAYDAAPERQPAPVFGAAARQHQNGATAAVPCAQPAHPAPSGLVPGQGPVLSVAMKLLKGGRFGLQCGFNQAVSDACRRLGGRFEQGPGKGRAAGKLWTFELVARAEVERALQEVPGVRVDLVGLHPLPLRMLEEIGERTDDSERWSEVPESIRSKMYDFQIEGVKFALRQGGRVLFGDEMGLGKSVQACATLAAYRDEWPALIITPTSLRDQWVESLEQWLHVPAREVVALSASRDVAQIASAHARFVVVSYDLLSKESKAMLQQGFRVVVCDEAHMIKSPTAKRTQAALPILRKANRVILLSGTPTTNRPIELYPQLQALLPKSVRSKEEYGERYCAGGRFGTFTGASHSDELHAILVAGVMIRRLKEDVTKDLPPKVRRTVELRVSDRDMAPLYPVWSQLEAVGARLKEIQARRGVSAREDATGLEMEQKRIMNQLYDMSATAKVAAVQQHLASLLAAKRKFIVFAHHQTLLNGCEAACRRAGADFIRIDGQTPADDRAEKVRRFQADANVRVAVLSIRAAGAGITLTAAALAVFAELSWTPGEHRQAEDRVHRIGQTRPVEASYLLAPKTIDDIIWETLQTKLGKVGLVLDGASNGLRVEGRGFQGDARQQSLQGFLVPSGSQPAASQPAASQPAASQPVRRVAGPAEVGQWTCGPCGTRCGEDSSSFTQCRVCSALRPGHWQCNACTLINGPGGTLCRACGTADSPPAKKARVGPPQ